MQCSQYELFVNGECVCLTGYIRGSDTRCYPIQCQPGFYFEPNANKCVPRCTYGTDWSPQLGKCIPQCQQGYVYDNSYNNCIPVCAQKLRWNGRECVCTDQNCGCPANQRWNGRECVCVTGNCGIVCGGNTYWDDQLQRCIPSCPPSSQWNSMLNRCVPIPPACLGGKVWDGYRCSCPEGRSENQNGVCIKPCSKDLITLPNG